MVLFSSGLSNSDYVTLVPLKIIQNVPSEGNQHHIVFLGHFDQVLGLLMGDNKYYVVDSPRQLRVPQHEQLLQGVPVRVVDPGQLGRVNFFHFSLDGLDEGRVLDLGIDGDVLLGLDGVVDIDADDCLCPLLELGHFLAGKLVPVTGNVHGAVVIDHELGVLVAPPVNLEPLLLVANGLVALDLLPGQLEAPLQIL